jgi:microcystin-dependent protein
MAHTAPSFFSRRVPVWRRLAVHSACGLAVLAACAQARADFEPFLGSVMPMAGKPGGSDCPKGWLPANGQILAVRTNSALFSLLGVTYGGDGVNTFGLPDLRGRAPVGMGQGPGLSPLSWGEQGGLANTTLSPANLPAHSHGLNASTTAATHATPDATRALAQAQNAGVYASSGPQVTLAQSGQTGGNTPVPTMSPSLVIQWCIAIQGIFPPRP